MREEDMEHIEIRKPMSITKDGKIYVGIYENRLKNAIRNHNGRIMISAHGKTAVHDAREWMRTGNKIYKAYNYDDSPMTLWCNYV